MKITEVKSLAIEDVKVVKFARFQDNRGYFTEIFRKDDFFNNILMKESFQGFEILQQNESFSKPNVVRGLHFQWNPFMGKLVRTVRGRMVDLVLDIRKNSPTLGKIIMYDMPSSPDQESGELIWVPPGFAHGNFFTEETIIEYNCTGQYSPGCEAGISPIADDLDWSLCDSVLKDAFDQIMVADFLMSEKDQLGFKLSDWLNDSRSDNFIYKQC
ncbi:MAG: dTDP-4-dehydrorhamnose 3,5-epimerase family protein [Candidatus Kapabacteria bacterium]|nr:dTDP-4-dehydrorhamnose 3,5-epimerase family protein [Candidatus Kapabacteria bacterium]